MARHAARTDDQAEGADARAGRAAARQRDAGATPTSQRLMQMQATAGNRAVVQMLRSDTPVVQRGIGSFLKKIFGKKGSGKEAPTTAFPEPGSRIPNGSTDIAPPQVITIGGEKVAISDPAERVEAQQIIQTLTETYGISLSWSTTRQAIIDDYASVPETAHGGLQQGVWQMKELRALLRATSRFAPILGPARESSSQRDRAQGVTTVGRLNDTFSEDSATAEVESGTMGEYFESGRTVGLFDTVTDLSDNRYIPEGGTVGDNATTLEANAIHEMSHGLIEPYARGDWVSGLDFWTDAYTASGEEGAEAPPTGYGHTSAGEDMAESFAIFFTNRPRLKSIAPEREALIASIVAAWTPPMAKKVVAASVTATGTGD